MNIPAIIERSSTTKVVKTRTSGNLRSGFWE